MAERERLGEFVQEDVDNAVKALRSVRSAWLRDPAVVAVDVGYKLVNGKPVDSCHLFFEGKDHNKRRLCTEEVATAFGISNEEAKEATVKGLSKSKQGITKERYKKPWIRVHVDRRLTTDQLNTLGRNAYHHGMEFDGQRIEVDVVDALYKPLAYVTHEEWTAAQKEWEEKFEREQRNRRAADSRDRATAEEDLLFHESEFEERIRKIEEKLRERYALAHLETTSVEKRGRAEPLTGGVSIGTSTYSCGTLSTIVWDKTDCKPCILSNWHILAAGGAEVGAACIQPSRMDGGTKARDTVAHLKRWQLSPNVDAALAELNGTRGYAAGSILNGPEGKGAVAINGILKATESELLGLPIWKLGRTSGVTEGFVDGVAMSLCVEYGDGTTQIFHDQLHIIPDRNRVAAAAGGEREIAEVSQAGDSGAIWMNCQNQAVGLQFAGDITNSPLGDFAVANLMIKVAEELEFSLEPVFLHPRVMEERQRDAEIRAAILQIQPDGTAQETAQALVEVLAEILGRVVERFDEGDVNRAMTRIRQVLGPINLPETRPGGGPGT